MASEQIKSPYSLNAMLDFTSNNAGLLFLGVALLVVGFLSGSMWRENSMLKAGYAGTGAGTTPIAADPNGQAAAPAAAVQLSDADWKAAQENPVGVIGKDNAKVTIVEFTDYQCPFCARHYTTAHKQIKEKYIDTGKVKILLRDQPLSFHPNAQISAAAVRCAADQNKSKLEGMHDALFAKQTEWSDLSTDEALKKYAGYATGIGLNGDNLVKCITDKKFDKQIKDDMALGTKLGASGTPTFFINGKTVVGAQEFSTFEQEIEAALKS